LKSRFEELREIAHENIVMMRKIENVRPSYEVKKFEEDCGKHLKLS